MRLLALWAALPAVLAAPAKSPRPGHIKDQWIVKLQDGASSEDLQSIITDAKHTFGAEPVHAYDYGDFKGFSIRGLGRVATALNNDDNVVFVEQDQIVKTNDLVTQENPPYGLARISYREKGTDTYVYDSSAAAWIYAYIIDTGIYAEHNDFEGRATFGANFADHDDRDVNGHGTHVAGTIGSKTFGVAKKCNLISVKVLGADGVGSLSSLIAGIGWAVQDSKNNSRINKSVANLSLGSDFSAIANEAVNAAVKEGLFTAVSAGNDGRPVKKNSPASAPAACTVGAIDENDVRPDFSNYGMLVDVFAPGVFIESTWIDGSDSTAVLTGTSMASPHVAGLGAYRLGLGYGGKGGVRVCAEIKRIATASAVVNAKRSPNRIAFNGSGEQKNEGLSARWAKTEAGKNKGQ